MYNALRFAQPPYGIRHYRFPVSTWKHFERLPRLPRGVLPVADALCRFNPIHGQGMSSAAKQARLLQDVLGRAAAEPDPIAAVQAGFMAEVASVLETPWNMSTSADLAFPGTRGDRPENFAEAQQFEADLFRAVAADPVVHRAMMEVGHSCCSLTLGCSNRTFCDGSRRSSQGSRLNARHSKFRSARALGIATQFPFAEIIPQLPEPFSPARQSRRFDMTVSNVAARVRSRIELSAEFFDDVLWR